MRTTVIIGLVALVVLAGCSGPAGLGDGNGGDQPGDGNDNGAIGGNGNGAPTGNGNGPVGGNGNGNGASVSGDGAVEDGETIGYSVGGASDINNFRDNIDEGYLPTPADVTAEGVFKEYYFDTGAEERCTELFCPSYSQAVSADPLSGEREEFLTVGLNSGIEESYFERPPLDLVVVVDTSGSMGESFDRYYYDDDGEKVETDQRQKMAAARDAVGSMLDQLDGRDRVGVVTFSDSAHTAVPMERVDEREMSAVRQDVRGLQSGGGTNLDAGMSEARSMVSEYAAEAGRETRIVYVTDAMPNRGGTSLGALGSQLENDAGNGVYSTFVGVGVDFNARLVEEITGIRGANYYSVHSAAQFQERMDEGFDYMVTPLVFDLSLSMETDGYEIEAVHGTPSDDAPDGDIMHVETLFPSKTADGRTKGGVILIELEETEPGGTIELTTSYENRAGEASTTTERIQFEDRQPEHFDNDGIRKAVALARYAELSQNWLNYERAVMENENPDDPEGGIGDREYPSLGQWERQSLALHVSPGYADRFRTFAEYFQGEIEALGDETMYEELDVMRTLIEEGGGEPVQESADDRENDGAPDAVGAMQPST